MLLRLQLIRHRFPCTPLVAAIVGGLVCSLPAPAVMAESRFNQYQMADTELATIALAIDEATDVSRKLGTPCQVPGATHETISYVYRGGDGSYLRFVVNTSPSDVDYRLVESMTMSVDPIVPAACSKLGETAGRDHLLKVHTRKGVQLGDSIEAILRLYGEPNEQQVAGARTRLRYDLGYETDRYYHWILTFRDGRLVEWTAEAIPFFIEVGG